MEGVTNETVGNSFEVDLLQKARDKTLEVIIEAAKQVKPGMLESEAKRLVNRIQKDLGAEKAWHPPQIRFGQNTLLPFGKTGAPDPVLKENDIFFFDIGPIFFGHEGDVGRPFAVGADAEMQRCCLDAEALWNDVASLWKKTGASGKELYAFAASRAQELGWLLALEKANGHRVADFPHIARKRGSVEGLEKTPQPNRWILEIQIKHPSRPFGAFFEDLLN